MAVRNLVGQNFRKCGELLHARNLLLKMKGAIRAVQGKQCCMEV